MDAIYARQSLDKKDSLSIESQISLCAAAAQGEYQVYHDRGFSGKNTHRPAFQQLMRDVEAGQIKKILVYRLDRFSRSIADFGQVWKQLETKGVQFESITEKFDTASPMGRAMLNIIMVFAQLERETTAERVRDNYYHRLQLGAWPGGPAPFGFTLGKATDDSGRLVSILIPNDHADVVQQIFSRYALDDESLGSVARWLAAQNIFPGKRKAWDNVAVSRILHNPAYVAADEDVFWFFSGQGVPISHPLEAFDGSHACHLVGKRSRAKERYNTPSEQHLSLAYHTGLVPSSLWLTCQQKLAQNRQISRLSVGKHSWLSGLLKCAACGYSVKINFCDGRFYLQCSGRSNLKICSAQHTIELRELEAVIEQEIYRVLEQCPPEPLPDPNNGECAAKLVEIDQKIERLVQAIAAGSSLAMTYIEREIKRLDDEKQKLLAEQARSANHAQVRRIEFSKLDFNEKKIVARNLIQAVRLNGDHAEINWKF